MQEPARHVPDLPDDVVMASLLGAHAHLAQRRGRAVRYRPDVSPFAALPPDADDADWADLARLTTSSTPSARRGGGGTGEAGAVLMGELPHGVPDAWLRVGEPLPGVQMIDAAVDARSCDEAVTLGPEDADDMLALARATQPGPFERCTPLMGRYLGIRRGGALVAMAGERLRPPGWVEVSAVAAHPSVRGQGLGGDLVRAVVAGARADGSRSLLHVEEASPARRLYERLGFEVRRSVVLHRLRPPGVTGDGGAGRG